MNRTERNENPRYRRLFTIMLVAATIMVAGCSTTLVTPYDLNLVTGTDALYKKAAGMISKGIAVSPRKDAQRAAIANPSGHPGHFKVFKPIYDDLLVDTDALILLAMSANLEIGAVGRNLQDKIKQVIDEVEPDQCPELRQAFGEVNLTAQNLIDLKCLFTKWSLRHNDRQWTRGTGILKRANWEGRRLSLFNTVLEIQRAQNFKRGRKAK